MSLKSIDYGLTKNVHNVYAEVTKPKLYECSRYGQRKMWSYVVELLEPTEGDLEHKINELEINSKNKSNRKLYRDINKFKFWISGSHGSRIKITVFWYIAPCSLVEAYRHFRGAHQSDNGGITHLWNVGLLQRDCTLLFAIIL
jgi:hypothetical protein